MSTMTTTLAYAHGVQAGDVTIVSNELASGTRWATVVVGGVSVLMFPDKGTTTRAILESIRDAAQAAIDAEQSDPAPESVELEAVGS